MRIPSLAALALGLAVLGLAGCGERQSAAPAEPATPAGRAASTARLRLAVIPKGANQVFWKSVHAGAVKAAAELGVEVLWKGPLKEDDRESQIRVVEDFITRGVDGLVLAPLDDVALRPAVNEAVRARLPVVIMDSPLSGTNYVSFVATDNEEGGRRAARHLAALLNGTGRVIVFRFLEGSASTEQRVAGFLDELRKTPGLEVVSASQRSGATAEVAYQNAENLLALFKTGGTLKVDGIFCPNEFTTFAMLRALQDGGLAGKVKFVGFDSSEMLVAALRKGELHGLVLQDPIRMGYLAVKTLVAHLRGEPVPPRIDTGSTVATPANMDDPAIRALLEPDYRRWLGEE
jgi:ribose transport system substrate-binding protein